MAIAGSPLAEADVQGGVDHAPEAALPDAEDLVTAYLTARRWVDAFELPPRDDDVGRVSITNASGVCVQLRRSGRVLGAGVIAPTPHIDRDLKLRRALGRAMSQVLGDTAVSRLPEELRDDVGRSLVLELEVAGPPERLLARHFEHVAKQIEPGIHGVALRRGDRWAMIFPSQLLATNSADRIAARAMLLVEDLGVTETDLGRLIENHNVSVYRFRTSHLVQTSPDQLPFEALRGDRQVAIGEVNSESIQKAMDDLARHILRRAWPENDEAARHLPDELISGHSPVLLGDYRPVADRYDPLVAPPLDQALSAFALARYAAIPTADEATAREAATLAVRILNSLRDQIEHPEADMRSSAVYAASLHAIDEILTLNDGLVELQTERGAKDHWHDALEKWANELNRQLLAALPSAANRPGGNPIVTDRDPHTIAMVSSALTNRMRRFEPDQADPLVRQTLDLLWEHVPLEQTVALLPWIGWAERDMAALTGAGIGNVERFAVLREALHDAQVGYGERGMKRDYPPDLHGGFILAGRHRPDSQSIRPMIWLASAMRHPELIDPESRAEQASRLRGMIRFLMQLTVRESAIWSLRDPERAMGGVRTSLWDSDLPLVAQAMAMLALAEFIQTLEDDLESAP